MTSKRFDGIKNTSTHTILEPLSPITTKELVTQIGEVFVDNYVYPELGQKYHEVLQHKLAEGKYNDLNLEQLAQLVHLDIQGTRPDLHNRVASRDNPKYERYFKMADRMSKRKVRVKDDTGDGKQSPPRRRVVMQKGEAQGKNIEFVSGIEDVKVLEGNIGYLNLTMIHSVRSPDGDKVNEILGEMAATDALIIDLRQCKGGDAEMVHHLQNFIFGATEDEEIIIIETYMRPIDTIFKRRASPWTGGPSYRDKPVYVLVSGKTGSAAEDLAFSLKNHGRAILVGESTAGAGHPVDFFQITDDLLVMCAIGRSYDPLTDKGWEGTGVQPHVTIDSQQALDHTLALISSASE